MPSLSNRVVTIHDRKTSMRFASTEWEAINAICKREHIKRKTLFELINLNKDKRLGLTSSIRLFSIIYYKNSIDNKTQFVDSEFYSPIFEAIKGIV